MGKVKDTTNFMINQQEGNKILVNDNREYHYISYKYINKQGKNIMFIRVEESECFVFDGLGHIIDDSTLTKVRTKIGEFIGMAKVTKCGLDIISKTTKLTFTYLDILYIEAIKYVHDNCTEVIGDGTRKYYY